MALSRDPGGRLATADAAEPVWTPATRSEFSSRLTAAFATINIAIARSVAIAHIGGSTTVARYAAAGPRGAATAAHGAAPAAHAGG